MEEYLSTRQLHVQLQSFQVISILKIVELIEFLLLLAWAEKSNSQLKSLHRFRVKV